MASVNYLKLHGGRETKSKLLHSAKETRLEHTHSNEHINPEMTKFNYQTNSYAGACEVYDKRIAHLDAQQNANKRKDRVTCFGLEVPRPKDLPLEQMKPWAKRVINIISKQYGANNICGTYVHVDEVHDYVNALTKEINTSREHLQCYVVPEHNGKLNGKWFSSKQNMTKLNQAIHEMTMNEFGVQFMDGSKRKGPRVEYLKQKSRELEEEASLYPERYKTSLKKPSEASQGICNAIKDKQQALLLASQEASQEAIQKRIQERVALANGIISDAEQEEEDVYSVFK